MICEDSSMWTSLQSFQWRTGMSKNQYNSPHHATWVLSWWCGNTGHNWLLLFFSCSGHDELICSPRDGKRPHWAEMCIVVHNVSLLQERFIDVIVVVVGGGGGGGGFCHGKWWWWLQWWGGDGCLGGIIVVVITRFGNVVNLHLQSSRCRRWGWTINWELSKFPGW